MSHNDPSPRELAIIAKARQMAQEAGLDFTEVWPRYHRPDAILRRSAGLVACREATVYLLRTQQLGMFEIPTYPEIAMILNRGRTHSTIITQFQRAENRRLQAALP